MNCLFGGRVFFREGHDRHGMASVFLSTATNILDEAEGPTKTADDPGRSFIHGSTWPVFRFLWIM